MIIWLIFVNIVILFENIFKSLLKKLMIIILIKATQCSAWARWY